MAIVSGMHQKLLVGTVFAAVSTLLFYATGVDWSWAWDTQNIWPVAIAYFMAACFGVLPYGLLAALLGIGAGFGSEHQHRHERLVPERQRPVRRRAQPDVEPEPHPEIRRRQARG